MMIVKTAIKVLLIIAASSCCAGMVVVVVDALVPNNNNNNNNNNQRQQFSSLSLQQQQHQQQRGSLLEIELELEQEQETVDDKEVGMSTITMTMMKDLSAMKEKNKKKRRKKRSSCRCPGDDDFVNDDLMFMMDTDMDFFDGDDEKDYSSSIQDSSEEEDADETRREVLFSTIGAVWATVTTTTITATTAITTKPQPVMATAGVDAKMAFPDIVGGMSDRANKQCLVESLGNRECLVYQEDSSKFLYQGADSTILIERLRTTFGALEQIPLLVETKQWSKINSLLTGPMGQLSRTLSDIVKLHPTSQPKAQQIKNDVFALGTSLQQRQPSEILKYQQLTIQHLTEFIQQL